MQLSYQPVVIYVLYYFIKMWKILCMKKQRAICAKGSQWIVGTMEKVSTRKDYCKCPARSLKLRADPDSG